MLRHHQAALTEQCLACLFSLHTLPVIVWSLEGICPKFLLSQWSWSTSPSVEGGQLKAFQTWWITSGFWYYLQDKSAFVSILALVLIHCLLFERSRSSHSETTSQFFALWSHCRPLCHEALSLILWAFSCSLVCTLTRASIQVEFLWERELPLFLQPIVSQVFARSNSLRFSQDAETLKHYWKWHKVVDACQDLSLRRYLLTPEA